MTKQSFKAECDVNNILAQYATTGMLSHVNKRQGDYLDLSEFPNDYLQTMQIYQEAEHQFGQLPALLRKKFQNDPYQFVQFLSDPDNADAIVSMGLGTKPGAPAAGGTPGAGEPGAAAGGPPPSA